MANSHVSNINFNTKGDGTKWVSVSQIDGTGSIDPVATGTYLYIEEIYCSLAVATSTDAQALVRIRVTDAAGNVIWGGATGNGGHIGVPALGFSVDWVSEVGTTPAAEVTVIYRYISGTAPTAV